MKKVTVDEIHNYLSTNWYSDDSWTDFNLAIDEGYTDYAAWLIWGAGAINSNEVSEEHKRIEVAIENLMKNYEESEDREELLNLCEVWVREEDNEHAFINVMHLMNDSDMIKMGFLKT